MTERTSGNARPPADETGRAGSVYLEYFTAILKSQDDRKASIESRGLSVITTSGALVTLLFGLTALLTKAQDYELPKQAHGPLGVALALFGLAALLALASNMPLPGYKNADESQFKAIFDEWDKPKDVAEKNVAYTRGQWYAAASKVNGWKANLLVGAITSEVFAMVAVAMAVREILVAV